MLLNYCWVSSEISRLVKRSNSKCHWGNESSWINRSLFQRKSVRNVAKFRSSFCTNFRAKVRGNKERNSRISLALLLHNTVARQRLPDQKWTVAAYFWTVCFWHPWFDSKKLLIIHKYICWCIFILEDFYPVLFYVLLLRLWFWILDNENFIFIF